MLTLFGLCGDVGDRICQKTNFPLRQARYWNLKTTLNFHKLKLYCRRKPKFWICQVRPSVCMSGEHQENFWVLAGFLFSIYFPFAGLQDSFFILSHPEPPYGVNISVCGHVMEAWLYHCDWLKARTHDSIWANYSLPRPFSGKGMHSATINLWPVNLSFC